MFVFSAISAVFRIQICGYKSYVHFQCGFRSISHTNMFVFRAIYGVPRAYKSEVTNPMFIFSQFSVVFRIQIGGYKPYVHFQCDFRSISHTNLRLQTVCSCFVRFLKYFAYKSEITNPMFVVSSTLHINLRLQTLCSFAM